MTQSPYEFAHAVSYELGLSTCEQDWGTINADGTRVLEFLEYYRNRLPTVPAARRDLFIYDMTELITESAMHRLNDQDHLDAPTLAALLDFWKSVGSHHAAELARIAFRDASHPGAVRLRKMLTPVDSSPFRL